MRMKFFHELTWRSSWAIFSTVIILSIFFGSPANGKYIEVGFDSQWRSNWHEVTFPGKQETTFSYRAKQDAVCAEARSSASGFARKLSQENKSIESISWEWKIKSPVKGGNARKKSGDDYAARVYLNFKNSDSLSYWESLKINAFEAIYDQTIPTRSLNFIWGNQTERGTVLPSPFTERASLIVMRNSSDTHGEWLHEKVSVPSRYEETFNDSYRPPHSVAIMTDSDNTGTVAEGCYRSLRIHFD